MALLKINLADVKDRVVLHKGRWPGKLVEAEYQEANKKGNPMMVFSWKIMSGPDKGEIAKSYAVLTPDALANLKQVLVAFGADEKAEVKFDPENVTFLGKQACIIIANKKMKSDATGEQIEVSNVAAVLPLSEVDKKPGLTMVTDDEESETPKKKSATLVDDDDEPEAPTKALAKKLGAKAAEDEDDAPPEDVKPAVKKVLKKAPAKKVNPLEEAAQKDWDGMDVEDRVKQAKSMGLSGKIGSKSWADLSTEEKTAMYELGEEAPF